MAIKFVDGQILFVDGAIAFANGCCCGAGCDPENCTACPTPEEMDGCASCGDVYPTAGRYFKLTGAGVCNIDAPLYVANWAGVGCLWGTNVGGSDPGQENVACKLLACEGTPACDPWWVFQYCGWSGTGYPCSVPACQTVYVPLHPISEGACPLVGVYTNGGLTLEIYDP